MNQYEVAMPSPFPGMDPYLEDPGLWPDVHHGLISEMQANLNAHVRPKYYVRVEERVYGTDEIFLVNSVIGLWPVASLGQKQWLPGAITAKISHWPATSSTTTCFGSRPL